MSLIFNFCKMNFCQTCYQDQLIVHEFTSFKSKSNFYLKLCMRGHFSTSFCHSFSRSERTCLIGSLLENHKTCDNLQGALHQESQMFSFFLLPLFAFMKLAEQPTVRFDAPLESPKALGMAALGQEFGATVTETSTLHCGTGGSC